jgi:SSS family transporter
MKSLIDLVLVVVYLAGVATLGIVLRGRQQQMGDYFLGNRRIAWPLILLSIVATETSTVTFLSVPGLGYAGNMQFLQVPIGYIVGRVAVAAFLMPLYFRREAITLYEILGRQFGPKVQRLNSALFIVTRTIADGLRLYLTATVVHELIQWEYWASILVVGLATIAYTYLGGIRAVVWTDFTQFFIYMIGAAVAGWVLLTQIPGGWTGLVATAVDDQKFQILDFRLDFRVRYSFWSGLIGGAFLSAATHGADQMMVQRYLCTDSVRHARLALISSGVVVLVQFAVFLLLGVALYVFYRNQPPSGPVDAVFSRFIIDQVPVGLRGLIIAAIFAAAMSTLSSSLNSVASAAVADIYRPLVCPSAGELHYLKVGRLLTLLAGFLQISVAWYGHRLSDRSTVDSVLAVAAFTTGITLGVLLLSLVQRRTGEAAALLAMLAGAATVTAVWLHSEIAGLWYALIGSVTTLLVGCAASALLGTKPASTSEQ